MPQLDVSTYLSQIFWLIIFFSILYVFMHFLIAPQLKQIFKKRRVFLEDKLEEVERFRQEIEKLEHKIEVISKASQQESRAQLAKIHKECTVIFEAEEEKFQKRMEDSLEKFQQELEVRLEKIEKELGPKQKDLATLITQKILEPSQPSKDRMV